MKKVIRIILISLILSTCLAITSFAGDKGGIGPCCASLCLGPRVGLEMNEGKKIRTLEWLHLVPVVGYIAIIFETYEAYTGKTMSEVASAESL